MQSCHPTWLAPINRQNQSIAFAQLATTGSFDGAIRADEHRTDQRGWLPVAATLRDGRTHHLDGFLHRHARVDFGFGGHESDFGGHTRGELSHAPLPGKQLRQQRMAQGGEIAGLVTSGGKLGEDGLSETDKCKKLLARTPFVNISRAIDPTTIQFPQHRCDRVAIVRTRTGQASFSECGKL